MKACPGLRSGIDRSGSLSFAIRDIPWSFRRTPESRGVGRGDCSAGACPQLRTDRFLCGLREAMVIPAIKSMPRTPIRGWNPGGRPAHPCHIESLWAVPPQPTVRVRSPFANAQDKLRSNLNSYGFGHQSTPPQCGRGACGRVLRRVRHSRIFPLYQNKCCIVTRKNDMLSTNIRSIWVLN